MTTDSDIVNMTQATRKMIKLKKKLSESLVEELESLDLEGLQRRIVRCAENIEDTERAREDDDDLKARKEAVKEASAPYSEGIKEQRLISTYCVLLKEAMGK